MKNTNNIMMAMAALIATTMMMAVAAIPALAQQPLTSQERHQQLVEQHQRQQQEAQPPPPTTTTTTATTLPPVVDEAKIAEILQNDPNRINNIQWRQVATEIIRTENMDNGNALLVIHSDTGWSAVVQDSDLVQQSIDGYGVRSIEFKCDGGFFMDGIYSHVVQKMSESGVLNVYVAQDGMILKQGGTGAAYGIVSIAGECIH